MTPRFRTISDSTDAFGAPLMTGGWLSLYKEDAECLSVQVHRDQH
jgi:hypothetical protein